MHPNLAKQVEIAALTAEFRPLLMLMQMVEPYADKARAVEARLKALGADMALVAEDVPPVPPSLILFRANPSMPTSTAPDGSSGTAPTNWARSRSSSDAAYWFQRSSATHWS